MYKNILIAVDGSNASTKAVEHGVELAKSVDAPVLLLTITEMWSALAMSAGIEAGLSNPVDDYEATAAASAKATLDAAQAIATREGVTSTCEHVPDQHPSDAIVAKAKQRNCDLIVMGSHGRRGLDRLLLGSQASEVLAQAEMPVLVVR